ncbi:MAG: cytidylate kinase-like family protein [Bacteroidales bacterium]|nr:cytidylate kinase-like family protein [Lachnoclostridium sp.]MCM1383887.1 cytidylate kinase-like family protein [Lachnoclostridium sp.]MCM1464460.1 cytidylate kinase-like family protein [Bacteroidales bacterium]
MAQMEKYVITISRQFASMGRSIAQMLSERLDIPFYDRDIVEETAKRMELPVSAISRKEEVSNSIYFKRQYPLGMGIQSMQDEIFMIQTNIIRDLADKDSCIIVGRCADSILSDYEKKLSVFVYAPYEVRCQNCIQFMNMDKATAEKMIKEVDKSRMLYHKRYCKGYKDELTNKDMALNSGIFGIEGSVRMLEEALKERLGKKE